MGDLRTNRIHEDGSAARRLFMVLSPRSLSYASLAIASLLRNAQEHLALTLITDSDEDKRTLIDLLDTTVSAQFPYDRKLGAFSDADMAERESLHFAAHSNLRAFRKGHPCWRKITDPILMSDDRQEMIILDPDLYFPNKFRFESTPNNGLLLMWQKPSCLLPEEVVQAAIDTGVALAHHTDIGVAQWRSPVDLEWLDWLIGKLGSSNLPRSMHVESIVWAALAMRVGGGHLDPQTWLCWHRSQYKRVLRRLGVGGPSILKFEPFDKIKCFHAGGEAKWWLAEAHKLGYLGGNRACLNETVLLPFTELTPNQFARLQNNRRRLRKTGYYWLFP
jgi:hypothetical protein